jgi:uncharacterized protein (UPF0332 family)
MVASNPNQLLERAEGTAKGATQRVGRDKSEDTALGAMADAVRAMWQAMNAVLLAVGISPDDEKLMTRISDEVIGRGVLSAETFRLLVDAQSVKSRAVYGADDADEAKAMKLLAWANEFIGVTRQAVKQVVLGEHDVVRILHDLRSDGYDLKSGITGTIVSVYNAGEAYAVEISAVEDGPAVVTLRANDMERIWKSHNE